MSLQINLKMLGNESLSIQADPSYTFDFLISQYKKKYKINEPVQISFAGIIIRSWLTLDRYQIPNHSTLYLFTEKDDEIIIFIKIDSKTIYPIPVKPKTKIGEIKSILNTKFNINFNSNHLQYNGKELYDEDELQNYRIRPESTISVVPIAQSTMRISIQKINSEDTFSIDICPHTKIIDVKYMMQDLEKAEYSTFDQILIYRNEQLEDYKTIQDYSIKSNSIILYHHIYQFKESLDFKKPNGEIITLEADPMDQMEQMRDIICKMTHRIPENVKIFNLGEEINYKDTVQTFSMRPELSFDVVFVTSRENKIVFVKKNDALFIPLEINGGKTAKDVKEMIFKREGIPVNEQTLVFDGNLLDDDFSMDNFLRSKRSKDDLNLILASTISIGVKNLKGELFTVSASPSDDAHAMRMQIAVHEKMRCRDIRLIFAGKQIEDGNTLSDYSISKGSTIHMVLRLRG